MANALIAFVLSFVSCVPLALAEERPWWHDAVFYEVFVRSFADSADGPLAGDGVGDFHGLTARLDYLNDGDPETDGDLGIDAVWLMPISPSPSYHGYDITDYTGINPEYGTKEDFRAFVDACHARGVRVIIDLVLNHTSDEHPWFVDAASGVDSPKRDWYVWSDEDPGYEGPWGQKVWHEQAPEGSGQYYYGCFYHGMPDLNVENPQVTTALKEVARFWIEDMGVDGFRLDAIKHLVEDGAEQENTQATIDWLEDFHAYCASLNPEFFAVGEVWSSTDEVKRYIPDAVDTAFEFDLALAILEGLNESDPGPIRDRLRVLEAAYDTPVATFVTNHDQSRIVTQLKGGRDAARAAATVLLTLPGVPFLYYGEEIGHSGGKPDPNIRTPMQWDADGDGFSSARPWRAAQGDADNVNVEGQLSDPGSMLSHYRDLIALRREYAALRSGSVEMLDASEGSVLAYTRRGGDGSALLVVVNMSAMPLRGVEVPLGVAQGEGVVRDLLRGSFVRGHKGWLSGDRRTFMVGPMVGYESFVFELPRAG